MLFDVDIPKENGLNYLQTVETLKMFSSFAVAFHSRSLNSFLDFCVHPQLSIVCRQRRSLIKVKVGRWNMQAHQGACSNFQLSEQPYTIFAFEALSAVMDPRYLNTICFRPDVFFIFFILI